MVDTSESKQIDTLESSVCKSFEEILNSEMFNLVLGRIIDQISWYDKEYFLTIFNILRNNINLSLKDKSRLIKLLDDDENIYFVAEHENWTNMVFSVHQKQPLVSDIKQLVDVVDNNNKKKLPFLKYIEKTNWTVWYFNIKTWKMIWSDMIYDDSLNKLIELLAYLMITL